MIAEIRSIIQGNFKVTEKIKLLSELHKTIDNDLREAGEQIYKGYKYCKHCQEYYRENTFENKAEHETREICTFRSLAEFDEDKYENKDCIVTYQICPMGHKEEINCQW